MDVRFIAEVSSNHKQDLGRCEQIITVAKEVGCDGVKFQLFEIERLFSQEAIRAKPDIKSKKSWELSAQFLPDLSRLAHQVGLQFLCTPFYLEAVDQLEPYVDAYKIGSYELLWLDLFRKCAATGKPLIFSTGMATLSEVEEALKAIGGYPTKEVTVLQCTSSYPAPPSEVNLKAMETLRKRLAPYSETFNLAIGYSDHTVLPGVILKAVYRYNAKLVEFHFDLDGSGEEYKVGHCWLPEQIKSVIQSVREAISADGSGEKEPSPSETHEREWRADPVDGRRPLKSIREKL